VGASGLSSAAGKTGTTNDSRDAWFVGMTPALVAGVWIGFDDPSTIVRNGSGGDLAAPVWASFMGVAGRDLRAAASWRPPPGVIEVAVDGSSRFGIAADCGVTGVRTEYFIQGTEPVEFCPSDLTYDPYGYGADSMGYRYYYDSAGQVNPYWTDLDTIAARLRRERQYTLDSIDAVQRARMDSLRMTPPGAGRPGSLPSTIPPGTGVPTTPSPTMPTAPNPSQPVMPTSPVPATPTQPPPPTTTPPASPTPPAPVPPTQPVTPAPSTPTTPPPVPPPPPDTSRTWGGPRVAPGPVGTPPVP
jgi:membrane peptidoglycan carboxypeptidase